MAHVVHLKNSRRNLGSNESISNILPLKTDQIDRAVVDPAFLRRPSIESGGFCGELREIISAVASLKGVGER